MRFTSMSTRGFVRQERQGSMLEQRYRDATKDELIDEIEASWQRLMVTMTARDEAAYTTASDAAGWTALDHMAHITAWERSALAPLQGRPRHEGLGVTDAEFAGDFDSINELVRAQTAGHSCRQVMDAARDLHRELVDAVRATDMDTLWTETAELCPDQREQAKSRPFLPVLMSDTSEHYDLHRGYIERILES